MKIGINIDGVLTDIEQWELDYFSKYYLEIYNKTIKNPDAHGSLKIFKGSPIQDRKLWSKAIHLYIKEAPRRFADEVIKKLKDEGFSIYIITNRCKDLSYVEDIDKEKMKQIVVNWLSQYNIIYDKIIFSKSNKLDVCKKEKIDIMIEDKPKNINKIAKKIPVLCFNAGYNKKCNGKNIIRCYSWYDIYSKIHELNFHKCN